MTRPTSARKFQHRLVVTPKKRELLWRILQQGDSSPTSARVDVLIAGLITAVKGYNQRQSDERRRSAAHEDLREVIMACADERNHIKIRRKIVRLPVLAREEVIRRAKIRRPDLTGSDELTWERICAWAQTCETKELIETLPGIISPGRRLSWGQLRKSGRRSAPHVEPMIMGEFQRLNSIGDQIGPQQKAERGGRDRDENVDELIRDLALLWLEATGSPPRSSRSTKTPFGQLAHLVLRCAGVESPQNALRRFWASVKLHRERPRRLP